MKKLFVLFCISCCCVSLAAQEIYPFRGKNGKYGLMKTINYLESEIIAKPKYDSCTVFWTFGRNAPIGEVKLKNKWGFINENGKEITPIKYDLCRGFCSGFATVKLNGKWGYVDTNGKETMLLGDYDDIGNTWHIIADVDYDSWGCVIEKDFSNIFIGNLIVIKINGKFGLIDSSENIVIPCKYDEIQKPDYLREYDCISVRIGNKWGMINNKGEEIIPVQYDEIDTDWSNDSVFVLHKDGKQGVVDYNGKEVISLKWDRCNPNSNGTTEVKRKEKYGLLENYTGKEILPIKYDAIGVFPDHNRFIVKSNGKYGIITKTGKEIIPFKYTRMRRFMDTSDNYFLGVELDGKWGFMDINGKEILPVKYDLIAYAWAGLDRFSVQLDGKWGMIDGKTGEEMIPIKYDEEIRFDFEQNHTVVESDGKFGIIDTAGREILPVIYDRCYPMNEELTRVILNEKWHLIKNSTNEEIIFPTECVETMYDYGTQDNIFLISCDNVLYFLDKTTYEITASVIFDEHGYIRLTDNYIAIKRNSKWGIINAMGKEILPCKYNLSKVQDKLRKKIKKT